MESILIKLILVHIIQHFNHYKKLQIKSSLNFLNGSVEGNIFRCRMKRDIASTDEKIFDLRDNWYLLFAHGNLSRGRNSLESMRRNQKTFIIPIYIN